MVGPFEDLSQPDMLVDGLEPFVDVLVLIFVEVLELLGLVRFFVQGDGTVAIPFPGRIRTYGLDLTDGLELCREVIGIVVVGVMGRLVFFIREGSDGMARCGVIVGRAGLRRFEGSTCRSWGGGD